MRSWGGLLFSLTVILYASFNYTLVTGLKGLLANFRKLIGTPNDKSDPEEAASLAGLFCRPA